MEKVQVVSLPRFTVVRLDDGRVGVLDNLGEPVVILNDRGLYVRRSTELEVVRYPAQLAHEYVQSLEESDA